MTAALEAALGYLDAGYSVLPIKPDGTKKPPIAWKEFQSRRMSPEEVRAEFHGRGGVAIICGQVSGNLEVLDFDDAETLELFLAIAECYVPGIRTRLPFVRTPRGSGHLYYKLLGVIAGSIKLALRAPAPGEKDPQTLIETRGEGAYAIAPGTPGCCHKSGREYVHESGPAITEAPLITDDEHELLFAIARSFDEMGDAADESSAAEPSDNNGLRPGDDFAGRATWKEILEPHSWTIHHERDGAIHWTRPGKDRKDGSSATTGFCKSRKTGHDLLRIFSSAAVPFEMGKAYNKFSAYALLNHEGDFNAAAKALYAQGYGDRADQEKAAEVENPPAALPWPEPPEPEAFYGLPGEIVRKLEPHTEADPIAILVQVLVAFGNIAGRYAHYVVEGAEHYMNLFAVVVGETSKARKGTSWAHVQRLFGSVEPDSTDPNGEAKDEKWAKDHVVHGGLSSGEGLIWQVRDPIIVRERVKGEKGEPPTYEDLEKDPGVSDKRLLVVESEFSVTLKVMAREGNTLSAVIRNAWDRGDLQSLTKNSPARARGAHISIIGHITRDELRRYMGATESANGYGNRHLWFCVRRSKSLPEGGDAHTIDWAPLVNRLRHALEFASREKRRGSERRQVMHRDEITREAWKAIYPKLSEGRPGLLGAVLARAEAQVLRLSMSYAMLDESATIRLEHLMAAVALWEYCERSAAYVFGDSTGDSMADDILRALRAAPDGLTRWDITNLFSRHQSASRIGQALAVLLQGRLATMNRIPSQDKGGRPAELWRANPSSVSAFGGYLETLRGFLRTSQAAGASNGVGNSEAEGFLRTSQEPEEDDPADGSGRDGGFLRTSQDSGDGYLARSGPDDEDHRTPPIPTSGTREGNRGTGECEESEETSGTPGGGNYREVPDPAKCEETSPAQDLRVGPEGAKCEETPSPRDRAAGSETAKCEETYQEGGASPPEGGEWI